MMTSPLQLKPLEKSELGEYGLAQVRDAAFEAVLKLWQRRQSEGWTQKRLAENINRDKATVSKYFRGPANWTMRTLGELVQALEADIRIMIDPLEDADPIGSNYDAYEEFDERGRPEKNCGNFEPPSVPYLLTTNPTPDLIFELPK
jgi:transcriptional regulator with XRE-family HTH domain